MFFLPVFDFCPDELLRAAGASLDVFRHRRWSPVFIFGNPTEPSG
jgi:hypothetical protein